MGYMHPKRFTSENGYVTAMTVFDSKTAVRRFQKRNRHLDPEAV
jgi:hypothetical protein